MTNPEENIYLLTDENGEEVACQLLDRTTVGGRHYVVVMPLDEEDSVMVYRVDVAEDGTESFTPEDDELICEDVFDYFRAAYDDYEFGSAE